MKHTPGPWKVQGSKVGFYIVTKTNNELLSIRPESAEGRLDFEGNLNLIASAPDMLEALKNTYALLRKIGHRIETGELINSVGAAIAKAEGK
jgi:hypothetical protein